jgi:DNA-binding CsgD family transcriptional regulator
MRATLGAALSAALTSPIDPLDRAATVIRAAFGMDRVSLARMDPEAGRFEIVATDGAELLAAGCELPVATCTYFLTTARGEEFVERDFARSRDFDLPLDGVVQAAGFRAGGSAPVRVAGRTVGAISFSHGAPHRAMSAAVHDVAALGPMLAPYLARRRSVPRPRLSPREHEVLAALEAGLRFKQIALALGISQATAKTHGRHLFRKLDVTSRAEAVHAARTLGLV